MLQVHHEGECPAYPVVCDKCNKDGIPRAKVQLVYMFFFFNWFNWTLTYSLCSEARGSLLLDLFSVLTLNALLVWYGKRRYKYYLIYYTALAQSSYLQTCFHQDWLSVVPKGRWSWREYVEICANCKSEKPIATHSRWGHPTRI